MKNSNDTIGNRTRDLPTCSAVPQPTALSRAPYLMYTSFGIHSSPSFNVTEANLRLPIKWPTVIIGLLMEILMMCAVGYLLC